MTLSEPNPSNDPTIVLADAVNQLAMIVEEVVVRYAQVGYTDENNARRRRWRKTLRQQREAIAGLLLE